MKRIIVAAELTDEQMEAEMAQHFAELDAKLEKFMEGRVKKFKKFEDDRWTYIERHSIQSLYNDYIKWFNKSVDDSGDGFDSWDPDDMMHILYKNGKIRTINPQWDDGTKKISIDNIDSIIINGGWGTAVAGPHIRLYNYREEVDYGKYGYRSVAQRYNDDDDIRADFDY